MRVVDGLFYTPEKNERQQIILYLPENKVCPVFIYMHGGGLEKGDRHHKVFGEYLAERGIALASVEYRMYPEARFPEYIEDSAAAVAFIMKGCGEYFEAEGFFVGGSSAGGYLSMMLCFADKYLGAHGILPTDISGYFHDAGQPTTHFNYLKYERGIDPRRDVVDEAAPVYFIGDAKRYSPMRFVVSETNDMKCRYEQTLMTIKTLEYLGYDMSSVSLVTTRLKHCEHVKKLDDGGNIMIGVMVENFIKEVLEK